MTSRYRNITVDCADARALAGFWAQVLGWHVFADDDPEVLVAAGFPNDGRGPSMLFIPVPEPRTVKNRLHLDLQPTDRTRDEEVERLLLLGATLVEDHRTAEGPGWVWLADPEGNDFCVERSAAERTGDPTGRFHITPLD
ncbi:VOC family protein [uncultured Jatrophihabitans sp.]|uniref:VOC family protein n=1 Tax=uncultured Jatrophihabitans sp. TaxID=1610747 RepID=UPI0035C96B98